MKATRYGRRIAHGALMVAYMSAGVDQDVRELAGHDRVVRLRSHPVPRAPC